MTKIIILALLFLPAISIAQDDDFDIPNIEVSTQNDSIIELVEELVRDIKIRVSTLTQIMRERGYASHPVIELGNEIVSEGNNFISNMRLEKIPDSLINQQIAKLGARILHWEAANKNLVKEAEEIRRTGKVPNGKTPTPKTEMKIIKGEKIE